MAANWLISALAFLRIVTLAQGNVPTFDEDTSGKQILLLPKDTAVGSRIYRLKASDSDRDYPLVFEVSSRSPKDIIRMEQIGQQEADVVLLKQLIKVGDMYVTNINVKDSSGEQTEIAFRINVTESRCSPDTVFVSYNKTYVVPENTEVGSVIGHVLARSSDYINRDVDLQLEGKGHFEISPIWEKPKIIRGSMTLTAPLDYETQSFYSLTVAAYNGYIDRSVDTRNIVYLPIFVVVADEQDTPPVFIQIPTVVQLTIGQIEGSTIFEVAAEDGDTANKRAIKYSIANGPDSHFFRVNSTNGKVAIVSSAVDISKQNGGVAIILTIQAEEVVIGGVVGDKEMTKKQVVVMPAISENSAPKFAQTQYEAEIEEHAPASTYVHMNGPTMVNDEDQGLSGVIRLKLADKDNLVENILEIEPPVIVNQGTFQIKVKNSNLLDFEVFHQLQFQIVAEEMSAHGLKSTAEVTLSLRDINDNSPQFTKNVYEATMSEDARAGVFIVQITATDPDQDANKKITYESMSGDEADKFTLDRETGRITLATSEHNFDREIKSEHLFTITASDNGSPPRTNTTQLLLRLVDANDNAPRFRQNVYEVVLVPEIPLTGPVLRLDAVDADEPESNNSMVRYELISGNWGDAFDLDRITGELRLRKPVSEASKQTEEGNSLMEREEGAYTLTVRAYDLGVPHQSSTATVYVYFKKPSSAMNVTITYIYPGTVNEINQNLDGVERLLARLNGAPTLITGVWPYQQESGRPGIQRRSVPNLDKSMVRTTVHYHKTTQVDLSAVARELNASAGVSIINFPNSGGSQNPDPSLITAGTSDYGWKVALITLLVLLAIFLLILMCFCFYRQCGRLDKTTKVHPDKTDKQLETNSRSQVIEVATIEQPIGNGSQESRGILVKGGDSEVDNFVTVDDTRVRNNYPPIGHNEYQERRLSGPQSQHNQPPAGDPKVSYSRHFHRSDPATTGNSVRVLHDHHNVYHHHLQHHNQHPTMAEIEEEAGEELEFSQPHHSNNYHSYRSLPHQHPYHQQMMGDDMFMVDPDWLHHPNDYASGEYFESYADPHDSRLPANGRRIWIKKYRGGGGSLPGDRFVQLPNDDDNNDRYPSERPKHRPRERARAVTRASFRDLETSSHQPTERVIKLESGEILQLGEINDSETFHKKPKLTEENEQNPADETNSSNVSPQSIHNSKDTLNNTNVNNNNNNINNNNTSSNAPQTNISTTKTKNAHPKTKPKGESRYMDWYNNSANNQIKAKHKMNCDRTKVNDEANKSSAQNPPSISDERAKLNERGTSPGNRPNAAALEAMEGEMRLGGNNPFNVEDEEEDSGFSGNTDSFKSSRKQFLEKKSLFTIAYNGMQNRQDALKERDTSSAGGDRLTS